MPKTIVCLANGTWNERASGHATNVVLVCDMLEQDTDRQVAKYDDGVGTGVFRLNGGGARRRVVGQRARTLPLHR